jgi:predicted aspartyl protease
MPPVTITFTDRYGWGGAKTNYSNRPYTWMRVHGPTGIYDLWALVDTGADYLMLDGTVANSVGINLSNASLIPVHSWWGGTSLPLVPNVQITVEGKSAAVDALFGNHGTPLLGRTAIIPAIDFGIDNIGWLYR